MIINRFSVLQSQKELLDGRRWTHRDIEEATGVALPTLSHLNRNKVRAFSASTIIALCRFFECDIGNLIVHIDAETGD